MNILAKTVLLVGTCVVIGSGCASYLRYEASKDEIAVRRAYASGDQRAIHAAKLGNGAAGIGIDISNLDALKEHPFQQLGCAILDAAMLYGAKEGIDSLNSKDDKPSTSITVNGNENNTTVVNGNSNSGNGSAENDSHNSSGE